MSPSWPLLIAGLAAVAGLLVVIGTFRKTRWGVNLGRHNCPSCQEPLPAIRVPQNSRQALWGGWTCPKCGTESDKWGRIVAEPGHTLPEADV